MQHYYNIDKHTFLYKEKEICQMQKNGKILAFG